MRKFISISIFVLFRLVLTAQTSDSFIGSWYVLGMHTVNMGDTLEMINGEVDVHDNSHFLNWIFRIDNSVKVKLSFKVKHDNEDPTFTVMQKLMQWRYFKENKWLYIGEEKFQVLQVNNLQLKLIRIE